MNKRFDNYFILSFRIINLDIMFFIKLMVNYFISLMMH